MATKEIISEDFTAKAPSDITSEIYIPDTPEIEIVQGGTGKAKGKGGLSQYAQELAFNEELIDIMVSESTDENAEDVIFTACNGVPQYFKRGVIQTVKRKYVAILASAKEHNITTPQFTTGDGARASGIRRTSSLKYPFMVVSDKNPRGAAWLKALLQSQT